MNVFRVVDFPLIRLRVLKTIEAAPDAVILFGGHPLLEPFRGSARLGCGVRVVEGFAGLRDGYLQIDEGTLIEVRDLPSRLVPGSDEDWIVQKDCA